jgi:hypothetical protein
MAVTRMSLPWVAGRESDNSSSRSFAMWTPNGSKYCSPISSFLAISWIGFKRDAMYCLQRRQAQTEVSPLVLLLALNACHSSDSRILLL